MQHFFSNLIGQDQVIQQLEAAAVHPVHAYLFVGPAGSGKRAAAHGFAATLLNDERALHGRHPDVAIVEREGASINVAQAREISRIALRSPSESNRKVLILTEFHLVDEAAPALLKTIEEASASTVFIILAETITKELVTVASRCVRIDFCSLSNEMVEAALVASGVDVGRAADVAAASFGNLDRARLLAVDDGVVARRKLWMTVLDRINGTGAVAAQLADEVVASIDLASAGLLARQGEEVAAAQESVKKAGQGVGSLKNIETRHKRELRRLRTDEVRAGLATLARELSHRMAMAQAVNSMNGLEEAFAAVKWATEALTYNANETLLLQGLFVRLSRQPTAVLTSR